MNESIRNHCGEIDRCNQRGGRMLSVVDLVDAGTFTPERAAYCLAAINRGASFLVGALPGGAGKTTVMGALLNFVPPDVRLRPADSLEAIRRGASTPRPRCCYICHEIGRGPYYAYLWGEELRAYLDLPEAGHMVATNLHADTYEQAVEQICGDNGVSPTALRRVNLMLFLEVSRGPRGTRRRLGSVWESDGVNEHRPVPAGDGAASSALVDEGAVAAAREVVDSLVSQGVRDIRDVRRRIVEGTKTPGLD